MRFLLNILLIIAFAFIAGIYLPWWSIAIVAFSVSVLIPQSNVKSFICGFLGIFFLWFALSLWIDENNHSILSRKIAAIFSLGSSILLVLVTALLGGLVGGFAALSGSSLRSGK